jgi:hypothetical protein
MHEASIIRPHCLPPVKPRAIISGVRVAAADEGGYSAIISRIPSEITAVSSSFANTACAHGHVAE